MHPSIQKTQQIPLRNNLFANESHPKKATLNSKIEIYKIAK